MKRLLFAFLILALAIPAYARSDKPGKGVKVQPARATWNTGYFQAALVEEGLKELGFKLKKTKELQNPLFYQAVALGDVDYWPNGWFPNHTSQMPKGWQDKVEIVGYVVKAGGLQGYLVSKKEVEKFNIKSLDDFKRPEVKKAFDDNGDGKADLTACPPGWGCEKVISHHLDVYGLKDHINPIKAGYSASMADTLARYSAGKPVFFYTWAPNWTIGKLEPGKDVMWINVPKIMPKESQMPGKDRMTVSGIKGAVTDPLKAGFVVSDIRIVANKKFLAKNPAAKKFFEVFTLPLSDINAQNTRMQDGENSRKDIKRHVKEWIQKNRKKWDSWLEAARNAA
ncbi:proline/glycine betaine ABC transporter substrate-binding protein ProX [Geothermobacter hydrogeniphilus]|uniref:Proline/glycine betaine ABC transporter substrate-binding protein ProX n=1 Tax=Geothermobacter hydrogeniphilus TaxID=1969733 RepID=A0A2K2HCX9_9BACT|nr:glycine betaine/L-proline ABC transporter substrate-binding protein ProX [Geothermobacter hydrogeniphilus]PNU21081.1 proline/glycine betaine ABC transporter substrate-binding protein ProX [Geothermobacter hydrogeniphilus]